MAEDELVYVTIRPFVMQIKGDDSTRREMKPGDSFGVVWPKGGVKHTRFISHNVCERWYLRKLRRQYPDPINSVPWVTPRDLRETED